MYKIGKSLVVAAVFATGSICAFEDLNLNALAEAGVITNTPGTLENVAEKFAKELAHNEVVVAATTIVTEATANAAGKAAEIAAKIADSATTMAAKTTELGNQALASIGNAQIQNSTVVDVTVAVPTGVVEASVQASDLVTTIDVNTITVTQEANDVTTPVLTTEKNFTARMAESATGMSRSFLNYGLSDETIAAQNGTYYAANAAKIVAVALVTYGVYRATKYAYATYGKKMPKA